MWCSASPANLRANDGEIYAPFVRTGNPIIFMDIASAEMTKYAANGMLATRISFMNEIANLCERVGANVDMVRRESAAIRESDRRFFSRPGLRRIVLSQGRKGARAHRAEMGMELKVLQRSRK